MVQVIQCIDPVFDYRFEPELIRTSRAFGLPMPYIAICFIIVSYFSFSQAANKHSFSLRQRVRFHLFLFRIGPQVLVLCIGYSARTA